MAGLAALIALGVGAAIWLVIYRARRYRAEHAAAAEALLVDRGFVARAGNPVARVEAPQHRCFVAARSYDGLAGGAPVTIVFGNWLGEQYLVNRTMVPVTLPCVAAYLEPTPEPSVLASFAAHPDVRLAMAIGQGALVVWREQPDQKVLEGQLAQLARLHQL